MKIWEMAPNFNSSPSRVAKKIWVSSSSKVAMDIWEMAPDFNSGPSRVTVKIWVSSVWIEWEMSLNLLFPLNGIFVIHFMNALDLSVQLYAVGTLK